MAKKSSPKMPKAKKAVEVVLLSDLPVTKQVTSRSVRHAAAGAVFVTVAIQVALFVAYWRYMDRMVATNCACALTPEFAWMRTLLKASIALYALSLTCVLGMRIVPQSLLFTMGSLSTLVTLALSVLVVVWFLKMREISCKCSDAWEKSLWTVLSALHVVIALMAIFSLGAAASV